MRTAHTLAKTHDGKWLMLHGPDIDLNVQYKSFRSLLGTRTHPDYALISYWENESAVSFPPIQFLPVGEPRAAKKEIPMIPTKKKVLASIVGLGLSLLALNAHAGFQVLSPTNSTVLSATTNSLASSVSTATTTDVTFQPVCTFTNAATNTFAADVSTDGATWINRQVVIVLSQTVTTTNTVSGITNIPSAQRYPYWRWSVENPSIYATGAPKVLSYTKGGI
jgi:hypothetical protein